jgi:hypothetical protein
MLNGVGSSDDC